MNCPAAWILASNVLKLAPEALHPESHPLPGPNQPTGTRHGAHTRTKALRTKLGCVPRLSDRCRKYEQGWLGEPREVGSLREDDVTAVRLQTILGNRVCHTAPWEYIKSKVFTRARSGLPNPVGPKQEVAGAIPMQPLSPALHARVRRPCGPCHKADHMKAKPVPGLGRIAVTVRPGRRILLRRTSRI